MGGKFTEIGASQRLAALSASGLIDPSIEPALDRLTKLATAVLRVPVALISLVDRDRQFFKSQCGLPEPWSTTRETPLSHSFCQHVVSTGAPLVIADAREAEIVRENLAIRDLGVIAYAGVPITDTDGYVLGSFCAIDSKPRQWSPEDVELLRSLSIQVSVDVLLHAQAAKLAADLAEQRVVNADRQAMMRLNVHDLRTPLTALLLGLETLKYLGPLNAEQDEYMLLCKRNGQSLLTMINGILDIGSIELRGSTALRQESCNPSEIIAVATDQVQSLAAEKNIELRASPGCDIRMIAADFDKLVRVVVNLLANAIKFTNDHGRVELRVVDTSDGVEFTVSDTGIGMANADHIFEEGVRLDQDALSRHSTGLGLTFCKRIVEAHGGRIWFETKIGVGTTFQFTIPTAVAASVQTA